MKVVVQDEVLAGSIALPFVGTLTEEHTHVLEYISGRLQLRALRKDAPGAVYVDFLEGSLAHRAKKSGVKSEAIAKAVGLKRHPKQTVLDATAGLGRDAFVLASLGCDVTMLDSSPVVAALLKDGVDRASELPVVSERMHFHEIDSIAYMIQHPLGYDTVYLDPMFPPKSKSALVKKEMQLLQEVVQDPTPPEDLFRAAFACAKHRIVVKRARLSQLLVEQSPSYSVEGRSSRFDVYVKG